MRQERQAWLNVVIAAVMMVATLPGRTQGLGLITEPLLADLGLDRVIYANLNLGATLLGALLCLPAGWVFDRFGLRWPTAAILLLLSAVVFTLGSTSGGIPSLFVLILLTRALGQSALSVASITAVGKSFSKASGAAMGVYAVVLSVLFAAAFVVIGGIVRDSGWRGAWFDVGLFLAFCVIPLVLFGLRLPKKPSARNETASETGSLGLWQAIRTPAFWTFGGAAAVFALVSSGLGLFNEAVLAERGFDQKTYHTFLAVTTLIALVGQVLSGWLILRMSMQRLLGAALFLYGAAIAVLPLLVSQTQLWVFAALMGLSGGMITVIFFAIWGQAFGSKNLGRIQGAAQMLTVLASAIGPVIFAQCHSISGSYAPALWILAPLVISLAFTALRVPMPKRADNCPTPLPVGCR